MKKAEEEIADFLTYNVDKLENIKQNHPELSDGFSNVIKALFDTYVGAGMPNTSNNVTEIEESILNDNLSNQIKAMLLCQFRDSTTGDFYKISNWTYEGGEWIIVEFLLLSTTKKKKITIHKTQWLQFVQGEIQSDMQLYNVKEEVVADRPSSASLLFYLLIGRKTNLNGIPSGIITYAGAWTTGTGTALSIENIDTRESKTYAIDTSDDLDVPIQIINNGNPKPLYDTPLGDSIYIQSVWNRDKQVPFPPKAKTTQSNVGSVYPIGYDIAPNTGNRKGPSQSASQTDEEVMAVGNDGEWWRISVESSGVKKWRRMKTKPTSEVVPLTELSKEELLRKKEEAEKVLDLFETDDPDYSDIKAKIEILNNYIENKK